MTYPIRLLNFYWGRLGYESHALPNKRQHTQGSPEGDPSEELARIATPEPSERAGSQGAASQTSMG
jgi:hypothetical protein